jgi:hypothetical protein
MQKVGRVALALARPSALADPCAGSGVHNVYPRVNLKFFLSTAQ